MYRTSMSHDFVSNESTGDYMNSGFGASTQAEESPARHAAHPLKPARLIVHIARNDKVLAIG